ncbi:MAG TPA: hypothetical protein PLX89_16380 [Verrucomicrobiota bacterium]|nr:hypothetical protein [Verrucomicrobiota bacterium]
MNELRATRVRVNSDFRASPFNAKISIAEKWRVHTMLFIRRNDMEAGNVYERLHHGDPQGAKPQAEVITQILARIKDRKARSNPESKQPAGFLRRAVLVSQFAYSWMTRSMRLSGTSHINATKT